MEYGTRACGRLGQLVRTAQGGKRTRKQAADLSGCAASTVVTCTLPIVSSFTTALLRIFFARSANLSVDRLSEKQLSRGLTFAMMQVFAFPPKESFSSCRRHAWLQK